MQILFRGTTPIQGQDIQVVCADKIMLSMLSTAPDPRTVNMSEAQLSDKRYMAVDSTLFYFISGATLHVFNSNNDFSIRHYRPDGRDLLAAIEELHMLDYLRKAQDKYNKVKSHLQGVVRLDSYNNKIVFPGYNINR